MYATRRSSFLLKKQSLYAITDFSRSKLNCDRIKTNLLACKGLSSVMTLPSGHS